MYIFRAGCIVALLVSQTTHLRAQDDSTKLEYFLSRGWGFECHRSAGTQVVHAVCARHVEQARARDFLGSLSALHRLNIESSTFGSGDVRSLARHCPSVCSVHIGGSWYRGPATLEAALWPELFEFRGLKHLSVEYLHCSGDEKWSGLGSTELETLRVSGNISGMLSALLGPCKVRSLRIEFLATKQQLAAADYATLNSHSEIKSLEILGDVFAGGMLVDLNALSGLGKLRRLTLRQCWIDPLSLQRFPALETLTLQGCRFIKHDFGTLLAHPSLESLVLWDYTNEDLRIAGVYAKPPRSLREITLRFPVFAEIKTFHSLPCIYHVQLGYGGVCGVTDKAHTLRYVGEDEITSLEALRQLRSVSVTGGADIVKVSAAALVRLARLDTLRRLEVVDAHLVQDASSRKREQESGLEEVRFQAVTPLSREFVTKFLGIAVRRVLVGPFSDEAKDAKPWHDAMLVGPKEVRLDEIALPVSSTGLEGRLLARSVDALRLDICDLKRGAIQQLVSSSPSLKRLALTACSVQDQRELLHLNDLTDLKWLDLTNTAVSGSTVRAIKAESVRFGTWFPQDN